MLSEQKKANYYLIWEDPELNTLKHRGTDRILAVLLLEAVRYGGRGRQEWQDFVTTDQQIQSLPETQRHGA